MHLVKIRIPNTNRSYEGELVGLDKQAQQLIVALSEESESLRPNMLVSVNLIVGGRAAHDDSPCGSDIERPRLLTPRLTCQ